MFKRLIIAAIVSAVASVTPALAQTPETGTPGAAETEQPPAPEKKKSAHKKQKKATKKVKAKSGGENTGTEQDSGAK
jgi:hypothetical protein